MTEQAATYTDSPDRGVWVSVNAGLRAILALVLLVAAASPRGTAASPASLGPRWVPMTRFIATELADMTTHDGPVYDSYLADRLHGRPLSQLEVISTINPALQQQASQKVTQQVSQLRASHVTDGALVSIDLRPGCFGCVLAEVGTAGLDRRTTQIDMANTARQPGSSFLPFAYLAGFEHNLAPGTMVADTPLQVKEKGGPWSVSNYDRRFHGTVSLRQALGNSYNVPGVKVTLWTGTRTVATVAWQLGIKHLWHDNPHCCGVSIALGGLERGVRLVEDTATYGALGTGGIRIIPIAVEQIADRSTGVVLWRRWQDPLLRQRPRVATAANAYMLSSMLSDNAARSQQFGLTSPLFLPRPVAVKTGFTNQFTDLWTVGYTPQIVTGVWVGNADDSPMVGTTGITGAAPIWHDVMLEAFQTLKLPPRQFHRPPGLTDGHVCRIANRAETAYGALPAPDLTVAGTVPYCTVPVRG